VHVAREEYKIKQIKKSETENIPGRHLLGSSTNQPEVFSQGKQRRLLALNTFVL